MPPDTPTSFCTSRGSLYKHSVPVLCPSNGDFLATPLELSQFSSVVIDDFPLTSRVCGSLIITPRIIPWGAATLVSCPARARLPARNGLVNEVEFLGLITQNE